MIVTEKFLVNLFYRSIGMWENVVSSKFRDNWKYQTYPVLHIWFCNSKGVLNKC